MLLEAAAPLLRDGKLALDMIGDGPMLASLKEIAERQGDDTTVPVLAKTKTDTGRIWTYVRDDQPFGGPGPSRWPTCWER